MLALLFWLYVAFGMVARSISPLVTPILSDLGLTYSQMGIILGSWQLTYIFAALAAGSILDRWGVYKSIIAGIIVIQQHIQGIVGKVSDPGIPGRPQAF